MPDIVLSTLNAKYIHPAFGLRYLLANLGPLQPRAGLVEFDLHRRPIDVVESLLALHPRLIGLGVYLWNLTAITDIVAILKRLRPDIAVILGGPEVSHECEQQPLVQLADCTITGEADLRFAEVCGMILNGGRPATRVLHAPPPELSSVRPPYAHYTDEDIANRVIYVEASRGCPFDCEFCLSSLDVPVRQAPLLQFLDQLKQLLDRGAKQVKFVDRTFNLNLETSRAILEFCLEHWQPGRFFHFELIPDRLPETLRQVIARFPAGALQLEVGVQSFNNEVCQRIRRRQDFSAVRENLEFLRTRTGAHLHADLIAGLPGESWESFAAGFDQLVALHPQEIQVGILKRLRGTSIGRHDAEWGMLYSPHPPYEILQNAQIPFADMQRLRRFARYWDLVGNSGNFLETAPLLWSGGGSPFAAFLRWSDWLFQQVGRTDAIALMGLAELLFRYLTGELGLDSTRTAGALWRDYRRGANRELPGFLSPFIARQTRRSRGDKTSLAPRRQARRLAT